MTGILVALLITVANFAMDSVARVDANVHYEGADSITEYVVENTRRDRNEALRTLDIDLAIQAVTSAAALGPTDHILALLSLESILRDTGFRAQADSVILYVCSVRCGDVTDRPEQLFRVLEHALSLEDAVRTERFQGVRSSLIEVLSRQLAPGSMIDASSPLHRVLRRQLGAMEKALSTALELNDIRTAAELTHSLAYTYLPSQRRFGASADAASVVARASEAAILFKELGDRSGESQALSIKALGYDRSLSGELADSALVTHERAIGLASAAPDEIRALLYRRRAVTYAARGDSSSSADPLHKADEVERDSLSRSFHYYFVSRAFLDGRAPGLALTYAERAFDLLPASSSMFNRARVHVLLAEAFGAVGGADYAIQSFSEAADIYRAMGEDYRALGSYIAAGEVALEFGFVDAAARVMTSSTELLARFEGNAAHIGARILNLSVLWLIVEEAWEEAGPILEEAERLAGSPAYLEWNEAQRLRSIIDIAYRANSTETEDPTVPGALPQLWTELPALFRGYPERAHNRPLTEGLEAFYQSRAVIQSWNHIDGNPAESSGLDRLREAGHPIAVQRAHGLVAWMYAHVGNVDSVRYHIQLAGASIDSAFVETVLEDAIFPGGPTASMRIRLDAMNPEAGKNYLLGELERHRAHANRIGEARALEVLGYWHFRRSPEPQPAQATAYYDSAATVLRGISQYHLADFQRVQWNEQYDRLNQEAALAWLGRAEEIGDEQAALGALAAADRGRGGAFEWMIGARGRLLDLDPYAGADLAEAATHMLPAHTVLAYALAQDTLVTWLWSYSSDAQRYYMKVYRQPLTSETLADLLVALQAAMGVDGVELRQIIRIAPPSAQARLVDALSDLAEILVPEDLASLVSEETSDAWRMRDDSSYTNAKRLTIIPTGAISAVPFTALPVPSTNTHIGEGFDLSYWPSLSFASWRYPRDMLRGGDAANPSQGSERSYLIVGNPTMPTVYDENGEPVVLQRLPGAEAEAREISSMLETEPLIGDEATLPAIRTRATTASVVHLATHGLAYGSEEKVDHSFLALAPSSDHDGIWSVADLIADKDLRLHSAELVVLSACQTGLGRVSAMEGTIGLQRAFLAAGAPTVLVSLWSVSDEATSLLMRRFYAHWLQGQSPAAALRRAQVDVRGEPGSRFHHSRYWAAFQLVGR